MHEAAYLPLGESPAEDPDWDVGVQDVLALPYYSGLGYAGAEVQRVSGRAPHEHVLRPGAGRGRCRGPARASAVFSADGHSLGEVDGFVVDADERITHFVLERGHLWRRKEDVAVPDPGHAPVSRATWCTSPCPRTRSVPSPRFASADTADASNSAHPERPPPFSRAPARPSGAKGRCHTSTHQRSALRGEGSAVAVLAARPRPMGSSAPTTRLSRIAPRRTDAANGDHTKQRNPRQRERVLAETEPLQPNASTSKSPSAVRPALP